MTKTVTFFLVSVCLVCVVCAATTKTTKTTKTTAKEKTITPASKAEKKCRAIFDDKNKLYAPGEQFNVSGQCILAKCNHDAILELKSCDEPVVPKNCRLKSEKNKPFPECCPKLDCSGKKS